MPSPFPGMDPYLEGYLWPDLHHRLAARISSQLNLEIAPRYVARIVVRTIVEDLESGEQVGVMLPDVEVTSGRIESPYAPPSPVAVADSITPATVTLSQPITYEVEIPTVEIRDVAGGILVTSIEILAPANKRGDGWHEYPAKRRTVLAAQANLLEVDLIRRGRRPVDLGLSPRAPYFVFLTRVPRRDQVQAWRIQLRDPLPTVPVPLRAPDPDAPLNLRTAFNVVYDEARYDLSVNYGKPPEYPLSDQDAEWAAQLLSKS